MSTPVCGTNRAGLDVCPERCSEKPASQMGHLSGASPGSRRDGENLNEIRGFRRCWHARRLLYEHMFASMVATRVAVDTLAGEFDATALSGEDAVRSVDELGAIRRVIDGLFAKAAKRVADTRAHAKRGAGNAAGFVGSRSGGTASETRAAIETATKLEQLPATDAAVKAGKLSAREAKMIADAATLNPDAEHDLLVAAGKGLVPLKDACIAARAKVEDPAARSARQHARRRLSMWIDDDGMVAGSFHLTPEAGGPVKAAFDAAVQRTFRSRRTGDEHEPLEAYAADALVEFVLNHHADPSGATTPTNATVHIVVDHGALMRGGAVEGEVCEIPGVGPVNLDWVRELLGTAFLTAIVRRGKDILTVAHLGRHVPAEVQTALLVSGRECDIGGCHQRGYLERDHVHDHAHGGPTSFANLGWLCYWHHRLKSAGWQLGPPDPKTRKRALHPPPGRAP